MQSGSPTSLGYNLIGDDTGCGYTPGTGDLLNVDPLLGPLRDNGGDTETHALLPGSPAIDQIPTELCVVDTDQRGVLRPQGSACDVGAYELEMGQWNEQVKLTASDGGADDWFGFSVALSGHTALVGVPLDELGEETDAGSVYVYRWDGNRWVELAKLTASDGEADDLFGINVALRGDTALVGAYLDDVGGVTDAGSVYVYHWDGTQWVEQAKLTASDGEGFDNFGVSVALSGNTILVGAVFGENTDAGSAYVFRWDGSQWVEEAKLTTSDGEASDNFGASVALKEGTALVGTWLDDVGDNPDAGSVYVYRWDGKTWAEHTHLTASDGEASDNFGYSVALSGNTALVGAFLDDVGGITNVGSAYVYRWNGSNWEEQAQLTASDGELGDLFGVSVALRGHIALVGAQRTDIGGVTDAGSAYVFRWDGIQWVEQAQLTASDSGTDAGFAFSVALSGNTVLVGAVLDDVGGNTGAGSAYVFRWEP